MNACVNVILLLRFRWRLFQNAAKRCLDMSTRTSEPVVKIEMAKSGVEVVRIKTADDISADPNAFGIAGRPGQLFRDFKQLIDAWRVFLLFALLLLGFVTLIRVVLRQDGPRRERDGKAESW